MNFNESNTNKFILFSSVGIVALYGGLMHIGRIFYFSASPPEYFLDLYLPVAPFEPLNVPQLLLIITILGAVWVACSGFVVLRTGIQKRLIKALWLGAFIFSLVAISYPLIILSAKDKAVAMAEEEYKSYFEASLDHPEMINDSYYSKYMLEELPLKIKKLK